MRTSWLAAFAAIPFYIACDGDEPIDDSGEGDADTDTDTDSDTDADTDTDTDPPLETAAIGFQFEFGWDQNKGIQAACYPSTDPKKPDCYVPTVVVTIPTIDYFSATTAEAQDAESCEFIALLEVEESTFPVETYDFDAGAPAGTPKTTWAAWEGTVSFEKKFIDELEEPECFNLDPKYFPSGDPIDTLNGMHIGIGIGPLTAGMGEILEKSDPDWEDFADDYFTGFVAMNHPDGSGGVDFTGYDWNYSLLFEVDENGVAVVEDDALVATPVTVPVNLRGLVRSFPYWYEDFPHLDFTILKDDPK